MKVAIVSGTATAPTTRVLCNSDRDLTHHNVRLNGAPVLELANFLRAEYIKVYDRKNRKTTLSFEADRLHDDPFEAQIFSLDHPGEVPATGLIEITLTHPTSAIQTKRWIEGGIEAVQLLSLQGATTRWSYSIVGGEILKTQPALPT